MLNFLNNIGPTELILLAVILIALFGAKAFTSLGNTAGESLKEVKNIKRSFNDAVEDKEPEKDKKEVSK